MLDEPRTFVLPFYFGYLSVEVLYAGFSGCGCSVRLIVKPSVCVRSCVHDVNVALWLLLIRYPLALKQISFVVVVQSSVLVLWLSCLYIVSA